MPRKPLIRLREYPYHVTIRCNNKEWFELPLELVWRICLEAIMKANFCHPIRIHAFVLMSNHYHLILYTPNEDLDKFMNILNSSISRSIRFYTGRANRIFGDRYKWTIINCKSYYENAIRYVFQNPLRANLVNKCEHYPYSTLFYQCKNEHLPFVVPKRFSTLEFLDYVNESVELEKLDKIKNDFFRRGFVK